MSDPFGTILSWIIITAASAYIAYHLAKVIRSRRLETLNGAAIMFGTGWLILELPGKVYRDLPSDAFDALSWFGIVVILGSMALEIWDRRANRNAQRQERPTN